MGRKGVTTTKLDEAQTMYMMEYIVDYLQTRNQNESGQVPYRDSWWIVLADKL